MRFLDGLNVAFLFACGFFLILDSASINHPNWAEFGFGLGCLLICTLQFVSAIAEWSRYSAQLKTAVHPAP
jgi:hypothetical protein